MRIFISSGGTKVPIDPVRDITNMSRGTFGAKIAAAALDQGHEVLYFISKDGRTPFTIIDEDYLTLGTEKFFQKKEWAVSVASRYQEAKYRNYDDYATDLSTHLAAFQPDIIILAAAVSDYTVDASDTKVRSSEDLTIHLNQAVKLISKVKQWNPDAFLVGFKLLVGSTEDDLLHAAQRSIEANGCDLVVANDFLKLRSGNHEIMLVSPEEVVTLQDNLAETLIAFAVHGREKQCTTS